MADIIRHNPCMVLYMNILNHVKGVINPDLRSLYSDVRRILMFSQYLIRIQIDAGDF